MSARNQPSDAQKAAAWQNSGGQVFNGKPVGKAKCPWGQCNYGLMDANRYGDAHRDDWVVDHIIVLANGGTNDHSNLQAMHNACNNEKGDS